MSTATETRTPGAATVPRPAKGKKEEAPAPKRVEVDWTTWRHGPIAAPVNAGGALAAAALIGRITEVAPACGIGVGLAAAVGVTVRAAMRDISPAGLAARATCWTAAGGWLTWALAGAPWPTAVGTLIAGTIGAALAAPEFADHETRVKAREKQAQDEAVITEAKIAANKALADFGAEWDARIARVCKVQGLKIVGVQHWPSGVGYDLEARLPSGGVTRQQLDQYLPGLATDVPLPNGCGIEIEPGKDRGHIIFKVSTVDTTAEAIPFPDDYSPISLNDLLAVGMHKGGALALIDLLNSRAFIAGQIGSGKTNLLQVINAMIARCTDALNWHIDLNGSGMSSPWLLPWLDGEMDTPPIDWVAPTVDEAVRMIHAAIRIAKARKQAYKRLMRKLNVDKLTISPEIPGIVITLDEGAEATAANRGDNRLATGLESLITISRAARLAIVLSSVRGTSDLVPAAIQAQAGTKIAMRPSDAAEAAYVLGWDCQKLIDEAATPGSGLIRQPGAPMRSLVAYRLEPDQIEAISKATIARRPTLDAPSAQAAGDDYTNRWARFGAWLQTQGEEAPMPPTPRTPNDPAPSQPTKLPELDDKYKGPGGMARAQQDMNDALEKAKERAREVQAERDRAANEPQIENRPAAGVDPTFEEIIAKSWTANEPELEQPAPPSSDRSEHIRRILKRAGAEGMHWKAIVADLGKVGITTSKATVYRDFDAMDDVMRVRDGVYAIKPDPA
ncbi:hypothetical protein [Kineosporia sp. NBRC 101731]|uniref:hypothetical protein n=1 Tax=Kineosporia sp. NBRC 101731 TaxID=3032199 RepID=UPI0024A2CE98|nr:hypothetical protein [Kineosporia sp. NBRC 101731]GLY32083.1 hypothetical protein Kisp02_54480 [Kineosporia sp. NBRC 101731]